METPEYSDNDGSAGQGQDRPLSPKDIVAQGDICHWLNMIDGENLDQVAGFWDQIDQDVAIVLHPDGQLVAVSMLWMWKGIVPQPYNDAH